MAPLSVDYVTSYVGSCKFMSAQCCSLSTPAVLLHVWLLRMGKDALHSSVARPPGYYTLQWSCQFARCCKWIWWRQFFMALFTACSRETAWLFLLPINEAVWIFQETYSKRDARHLGWAVYCCKKPHLLASWSDVKSMLQKISTYHETWLERVCWAIQVTLPHWGKVVLIKTRKLKFRASLTSLAGTYCY